MGSTATEDSSGAPKDGRPTDEHGPDRMHIAIRVAWIVLIVVGVTVLLAVAFERTTAAPQLCASCHEIEPKVRAWESGGHSTVGCPDCHEEPRPWYLYAEVLALRATVLARDVEAHYAGEGIEDTDSNEYVATIPDSRCLRCHDPGREISIKPGTLIDHDRHAESNGSCLSCHLTTAHPNPSEDGELLFMEQCFTCHGEPDNPDASEACETCHPEEFELRPESHGPEAWQTDHGERATADRSLCLMCHAESQCDTCHGVEMPHPAEWAEGATEHGPAVQEDREVCVRCHEDSPGFCSVCHHEGYDPAQGDWFPQHPNNARQQGGESCEECHERTFCSYCHTTTSIDGDTTLGGS
jgi:nitrate/TMAO reductase-like tetraheme cytochrome c subunit